MSEKSCNWIPAKLPAFAAGAVFTYPYGIELVHDLLNQFGVVGEDAGLKIACTFPFHSDACAGEVGAADVGYLVIKDQNLEMHPWTKLPLQAFKQRRVFVEVLAKSGTWLLGVDEPYLNAFFDELRQDRKEGLRLRPDLDIQVFDVGGANPEAAFDLGDTGNYFRVMSFICNEL